MKHTRLAALLIAPMFLLAGCDGILSNFDQKVDFAKFKEKVQGISHHEYESASAKGYTNKIDDLKEEYTWDGYNWIADSGNKTDVALGHIKENLTEAVKDIDTAYSASFINSHFEFKTGISGNFQIKIHYSEDGATVDSEMKYNKYGFVTRYYSKSSYSGSLISTNSTVDLTISYK